MRKGNSSEGITKPRLALVSRQGKLCLTREFKYRFNRLFTIHISYKVFHYDSRLVRLWSTCGWRLIKRTSPETVARHLEGAPTAPVGTDALTSSASNGGLAPPMAEGGVGENWGGTAEEARNKVRQYFTQLREALQQQEIVALRALDTHIRERICSIRQQQEDIANLLSQVCFQNCLILAF